jgi:hypothetical protein
MITNSRRVFFESDVFAFGVSHTREMRGIFHSIVKQSRCGPLSGKVIYIISHPRLASLSFIHCHRADANA